MNPPSFEPSTCTLGCLTSEKRLKTSGPFSLGAAPSHCKPNFPRDFPKVDSLKPLTF